MKKAWAMSMTLLGSLVTINSMPFLEYGMGAELPIFVFMNGGILALVGALWWLWLSMEDDRR